jgi:hypothetical protein
MEPVHLSMNVTKYTYTPLLNITSYSGILFGSLKNVGG